MNYEQKYKDALEIAREELRACGSTDCDAYRQIIRFFPELKESENEKIRKSLIDMLKNDEKCYLKEIAWLEKQEGCEYIKKDWLEHIKQSWYKEGFIDGKYSGETSKEWTINDDATLKELIDFLENGTTKLQHDLTRYANWLKIQFTPIEKHSEHKSVDKVEPKFKDGDWVVTDKNNIVQIKAIEDSKYVLENTMKFSVDYVDKCWRKWTIQDAKDGDVLANDYHILILKELAYDWSSNGTPNSVKAYCGIKPNGNFEIGKDNWCFCGTLHIHPATKEQRELLFKKMREAGYEWDAKKKRFI